MAEVPESYDVAGMIEIAGQTLVTFTNGEALFVSVESLDELIKVGVYVMTPYHIGGRGDEPTVEPANGNIGPRFVARSTMAQMWQVMEAVSA